MSRREYFGILYAVAAAVLWGVLAVTLKITNGFLPSTEIVWFRMTMSFFSLLIFYLFFNRSSLKILAKPPLLLIIGGIFLACNYIGYMEGIHHTTPANAQIFIQTGPLLLAVSGIIFFKEKLSVWQIMGFVVALIGFSIYYYDQSSFVTGNTYTYGILLILGAGVAWSIYAALQKKLVATYAAQQLNLVIYAISMLLFFPFIHLHNFAHLTTGQWGLLIFTYLNTLFSYGFIAKALQYLEANKVSSIIILNPILTFAFMAFLQLINVHWIRHEMFTIISVAGGLLVLIGALMVLLITNKKNEAQDI